MSRELMCYCGQAFQPQLIGAHMVDCPTRAQNSPIAYNINALRSQADSVQLEIVKGELQLEIYSLAAEIAAQKQAQGYR